MKRNIFKAMAMLIAFVMLFGIVGCSDATQNNPATNNSGETPDTENNSTPAVFEAQTTEKSANGTSDSLTYPHEIGYVEIFDYGNQNVDKPSSTVTEKGYYIPYGLTAYRDEGSNSIILSWKCDAPAGKGGKDQFEICISQIHKRYSVAQPEILMGKDGTFEYQMGELAQGAYRVYVHAMKGPNKVDGRDMAITFQVY